MAVNSTRVLLEVEAVADAPLLVVENTMPVGREDEWSRLSYRLCHSWTRMAGGTDARAFDERRQHCRYARCRVGALDSMLSYSYDTAFAQKRQLGETFSYSTADVFDARASPQLDTGCIGNTAERGGRSKCRLKQLNISRAL